MLSDLFEIKRKKEIITAIFGLILLLSSSPLWATNKGNVIEFEKVELDDAYESKVLGLFIGIQEFEDPFWHDLEFPKKDVQDMVAFFSSSETLRLDDAIVLTEPSETTRKVIWEQKLKEFEIKNSSEKDVVIVYVSGHGTLSLEARTTLGGNEEAILEKEPYLLTSDSKEGSIKETAIPLNQFISWFAGLKSNRKVLILDTCHSGRGGKSQLDPYQAKMLQSSKGVQYKPVEDSWASIILSSCPFGGTSFEDQKLQNGVYTHFLLEGMRQGDLNGDGAVSIFEAHNHSIDKTREFTGKNWKLKQVPTAYSEIRGKNPIYVNGKPKQKGDPILFSYSSENQGVEVLIDSKPQGMFPKGMSVSPGIHKLECRKNGVSLYSNEIEFKPDRDYLYTFLNNPYNYLGTQTLVFAEGAFRGYSRGEVAKDLLPDVPTAGISLYRFGDIKNWLGFSFGADFGQDDNVDQIAFRLGIKYQKPFNNSQFIIGPDLMAMTFKYKEDIIAGKNVESSMNFLAPGAEMLVSYKLKNQLSFLFGFRSHFMMYKLNKKEENIISNQAFISCGYSF